MLISVNFNLQYYSNVVPTGSHVAIFLSGFCYVCHLFLPLVSIFGLFPVLVSCHYELICVQLCVCDCVNYPVYLVPVF